MKWKKRINRILIILAIIIVGALAYSIKLVYNQQQLLNESIAALDRIIINVQKLEAKTLRLEVENMRLKELEDKTAREMEGFN